MPRLLPFLLVLAFATRTFGQSGAASENGRIELLNADRGEYDDRIAPGAQRLKGNVRFRHKDALMRCDSAYLYQDQRLQAFGHVTIDQGDTLHMQADRANYNGNDRMARLEGSVTMRNSDMELTTPALDYDMRNRRAVYTAGGRIVSRSGGNVLTSDVGTYLTDARRFIFSRNVLLAHPERTITSDTMHYTTSTGVAEFFGPTDIVQRRTTIRTLRGQYDTRNERARFTKRSTIDNEGRTLAGDSLHYDRKTGEGKAWGQVVVSDTASDMIVRGDEGRYNEITERAVITGHAELELWMDQDTLFLHGDTLFTTPDTAGKLVQAHRHVRFYRSDLQGACDTLIYSEGDSLISLFNDPILWSGTDQITGDHIRIVLRNGKADELFVEQDAFLISQVDSIHFDQVTGTDMTGKFGDDGLRSLFVEGNARTVYFAEETKNGVESIMGVNRADCSRIRVGLKNGKVDQVTFFDRPDAILYPLEKVPLEELRMQGSDWRAEERPSDRADIFRSIARASAP
ncbi:MAG: OstA-like protein [Flavobacteriales bacterium]